VKILKENKAPMTLDELDNKLDYEHPDHIKAVASISKLLASLNGLWGLAKWPSVNPKNIRDKIFVILEMKKEPMHFSDIAKEIKESNFKRKNVTIQAIHNELIKDSRFVLIGRGIYALSNWGYKKGTISEIIHSILEKSGEPMTREEIVKQVLKVRKVKETTILLNLQNKKLFKKVDKNLFTLA
jgi:DNA-directed RNA polymerase delta subunit